MVLRPEGENNKQDTKTQMLWELQWADFQLYVLESWEGS